MAILFSLRSSANRLSSLGFEFEAHVVEANILITPYKENEKSPEIAFHILFDKNSIKKVNFFSHSFYFN